MDIRTAIFQEIDIERRLQERYRTEGRFAMTCASPEMSTAQKLAVLAEEYGEAAHEVNEGFGEGRATDIHKLGKELIQCAAVAVAWMESHTMTREEAFSEVVKQIEHRDPCFQMAGLAEQFALLTYYFGQIGNESVLHLANLLVPRDFEAYLARFVAACILWLEQLDRS